eukprot:TRINITY_DN2130_c0_g1_i10.p1 TRINITY_DN2130_c0_g1~~TRINITY_DN2130_c0_g1_i10.p1  ORF type:complete len:170 (+),score=28.21 TRINITY_DN2130_c0_g1_i10:423-932(+)
MLDYSTGVNTLAQYVAGRVIDAKLGVGNPADTILMKQWEVDVIHVYKEVIDRAKELFEENSEIKLLCIPEGTFFGLITLPHVLGKKVPASVTLLDGRVVDNLPELTGVSVISTDVDLAHYLLYASEVVTVPASGFHYDPCSMVLRISFAVSSKTLEEAVRRMTNAITGL